MKTKTHSQSGSGVLFILVCAAASSILAGTLLAFLRPDMPAKVSQRTLTYAERVAYQRAIEDVYWRHRIWPEERSDPKPSLDAVISAEQIEKKVEDYLHNSQALETYWQGPIASEQLQAEIERMARDTKQPEVLRELFEALRNDPFVIAECLARPVLTERLAADLSAHDKGQRFALLQTQAAGGKFSITTLGTATSVLPEIDPCIDDTWTATSTTNAPSARAGHTAVSTGSEMIVWGGIPFTFPSGTGGRYNPITDSWTATSTTNAPSRRGNHTAVWTGSEMIVWGGFTGPNIVLNTGGRYNPGTDTWTATSITNAPSARSGHTGVWTGTEMIVWGGGTFVPSVLNTGGRYNPGTDSWTATSTTNAPDARADHTAVWAGSEMIVWGGANVGGTQVFNTGGRYCAQFGSSSPTPTPTATTTPTSTPTATPT